MRFATLLTALLPCLAGQAAAKDGRTFAVLRFNNQEGKFSAEGRMDPIVSPGQASGHSHGIQGGNKFALTVTGDQLLSSTCTSAKLAGDKSNYWVPTVWFQSPTNKTLKRVPMFYMNVYYFFESTNDKIVAFPPGLKILAGDAMLKTPPKNGDQQLDPSKGPIQAVQWTCPTSNSGGGTYPAGSDGKMSGMQDSQNKGAGAGFPAVNCDGYASPLRQDIHFPSCYNPQAGLNAAPHNMAYPTDAGDGKADCPKGWVHVPHMFYEVYWNTPEFASSWEPNNKDQPFVLANGDSTGYSSHGDFIAGWDTQLLQSIIDGCDAGDAGMDQCPQAGTLSDKEGCVIKSEFPEPSADEWVKALPGNNPVFGWAKGAAPAHPLRRRHGRRSHALRPRQLRRPLPGRLVFCLGRRRFRLPWWSDRRLWILGFRVVWFRVVRFRVVRFRFVWLRVVRLRVVRFRFVRLRILGFRVVWFRFVRVRLVGLWLVGIWFFGLWIVWVVRLRLFWFRLVELRLVGLQLFWLRLFWVGIVFWWKLGIRLILSGRFSVSLPSPHVDTEQLPIQLVILLLGGLSDCYHASPPPPPPSSQFRLRLLPELPRVRPSSSDSSDSSGNYPESGSKRRRHFRRHLPYQTHK